MEEQRCTNLENNKKSPCRKRRVRPIPLTSKILLYDKLLAEKEERFVLFPYILHVIFVSVNI